MNGENQIEELAEDIFLYCRAGLLEDDAKKIAEFVIDKRGYRKQEYIEWRYDTESECYICPRCGHSALNNYRGLSVDSNFCPYCGAEKSRRSKMEVKKIDYANIEQSILERNVDTIRKTIEDELNVIELLIRQSETEVIKKELNIQKTFGFRQ